jgi:hypothetical protein
MGVMVARALIGGIGALLLLGAIAVMASPVHDAIGAITLFVPGVLLVAAVVLERTRYRSLAAELTGHGHGPGGGEPARPEARFRPTDERFVDPTTGVPMRVYLDPGTGDRRYVPEA